MKPFIKKAEIPYVVILGNAEIAKTYGIENMPDTFLIDRQGRIAATYVGVVDKDNVETNIKAMLSEP